LLLLLCSGRVLIRRLRLLLLLASSLSFLLTLLSLRLVRLAAFFAAAASSLCIRDAGTGNDECCQRHRDRR
jgi:hypothetical protein